MKGVAQVQALGSCVSSSELPSAGVHLQGQVQVRRAGNRAETNPTRGHVTVSREDAASHKRYSLTLQSTLQQFLKEVNAV